jgi:adenylosuccinate lyase
MAVHTDRMQANLTLTHGALHSQAVLTALIEAGMGRDDAYALVQRTAQRALDEGTELRTLLEAEGSVTDLLSPSQLDELFDSRRFLRNAGAIFERVAELVDG